MLHPTRQLAITAFLLIVSINLHAVGPKSPPIQWSEPQSATLLARSTIKNDFFHLSGMYEAQNNKIFCGVASSVIVLNYSGPPKLDH